MIGKEYAIQNKYGLKRKERMALGCEDQVFFCKL